MLSCGPLNILQDGEGDGSGAVVVVGGAKVAVKRVSCFAFSVGVCCIVFAVRQGWRLRQQDTTKQDKTIRSFGIHGIKYNNEFTQMQIKMQMIRIGFRK